MAFSENLHFVFLSFLSKIHSVINIFVFLDDLRVSKIFELYNFINLLLFSLNSIAENHKNYRMPLFCIFDQEFFLIQIILRIF